MWFSQISILRFLISSNSLHPSRRVSFRPEAIAAHIDWKQSLLSYKIELTIGCSHYYYFMLSKLLGLSWLVVLNEKTSFQLLEKLNIPRIFAVFFLNIGWIKFKTLSLQYYSILFFHHKKSRRLPFFKCLLDNILNLTLSFCFLEVVWILRSWNKLKFITKRYNTSYLESLNCNFSVI